MIGRIWVVFVFAFMFYSYLVYSECDVANKEGVPNKTVASGWKVWQDKNCQSCHQLYGLGGYMGPDLTNIASDPVKGRKYMEAFIKKGTGRMPDLNLNDNEVNDLIEFLCWVDKSGLSRVPENSVHWSGTYRIDK